MPDHVIAVDGGNSKTDVVIVATTGRLLARVTGRGVVSPLTDLASWRAGLADLVARARREARLPATSKARYGVYMLANCDFANERRIAQGALAALGYSEHTVVHNDTVAVLRAGATRPWGVAIVAGAGINGVGVHPSGRVARFLALGPYTGDSGGGRDIGTAGLGAAIRARDGRGPATVLTSLVPRHFGVRTPEDVAIAVHSGTIVEDELHVLAPVVFAASASGDAVAINIIEAFGTEVATMAVALIRRLSLMRTDVEVVLGGGTLQTGDQLLLDHITAAITAQVPGALVSVLTVAPVVGAVVEAFRLLEIGKPAMTRARNAIPARSST
jgi:N-acetylglucosamine kinase-like BadF-type ATPase